MAMCAPADQPGFYLLGDAGGRFVVDREWGLISLRDESSLEHERGQIHDARLRVVEPSGTVYELALRLRISGRVPQVVSEDSDLASPEHQTAAAASAPTLAWTEYAATSVGRSVALVSDEQAPFGLISAPLPQQAVTDEGDLRLLADLPAPASASARWAM